MLFGGRAVSLLAARIAAARNCPFAKSSSMVVVCEKAWLASDRNGGGISR